MSSPPGTADAIHAPEHYREQLDTLVSLLQLAHEVPDMADPILLGQMVETLQQGSAAAGQSGVPDLLRSWQAALQDLGRRGGAPGPDDLTEMTRWFAGLQKYSDGLLDRDDRRVLARLPDAIDWLPRLSQSFTLVIARRLDAGAAAMDAMAPSSRVDAVSDDARNFDALVSDSGAALAERSVGHDAVQHYTVQHHTIQNDSGIRDDAISVIGAGSDAMVGAGAFHPAESHRSVSDDGNDIAAGAFAPDAPFDGAAPLSGDFDHDADRSATADAGAIWIGQEELDLTRQAILDQILPLAQAWADTPDAEASVPLIEELAYQCQLITNVMELIGTPTLALGMAAIRDGIERRDPEVSPEAVAMWCNALLAAIEQPGRDTADLLASVAPALPELDGDWTDALGHEFARVAIGFDPDMLSRRKTIAGFDDIGLAPADDVLPNVLDGMLRELPGNTARLGASVRALALTRSPAPIDEARRVAHTLKGDANTVGIRGLANLTHALEDILIVLAKRPDLLDDDCAELLTAAGDCVEEISDHLLGRGPAPDNLQNIYQHVLDTANALADGGVAPATEAQAPQSLAETSPTAQIPATAAAAAPSASIPAATVQADSGIRNLNVPSALLDELQRLAGETLVTSRQIDQQIDGLGRIHRDQRQGIRYTHELMGRLDDLVALRGAALQSTAQKAGADLDPLEIDQYNELHVISRQLLEAHADSGEFMRRIDRVMSGLSDLRSEQEQLNRDLQRTILRTRTVPFGQIAQRLQRIVRQTAKQLSKQVQLDIVGEDIPVDAELLERIVEPLAHLLRNAVDHGIESQQERLAARKPEQGRIVLRVGLQGDTATIELQDDGAGLDLDAIRSHAIGAGLLDPAQAVDERQLARMILLPGFSTRARASEVSGRGIGMDVVNQRIAALRGTLSIGTEAGRGTRMLLRLPVTQTLANVIIARGQLQVSAVVAASVERVVSFASGECRYDDGRLRVAVDDEILPALPLETFYDASADLSMWVGNSGIGLYVRDADGLATVVLVRSIDEVRSVVVKPISAYLPPIPAVRGITQLGDGGLAPVIDLDVLLQSAHTRRQDTRILSHAAAAVTRVVVADDSLSVRRALEQLMQDAGFEVETARDGFEALAAIQAKPTHALLVDLEMPRMNGLEVARNLRNQSATRDLPVIMITSRATDRHQAMAAEAGVTRMLGKPFSEDSLVALVRELIAGSANAG